MDIKVNGHSGCIIDVENIGTELRLIKKTNELKYIDRLFEQAEKQRRYTQNKYEAIKIPRILNLEKDNVHCRVEMEYVYSKNFVDFFETGDVYQIDAFAGAICHFIDVLIEKSEIQTVLREQMIRKFENVRERILVNPECQDDPEIREILAHSAGIFSLCRDMIIPVGYCHGDLTLSNVLFNGYNYYLIDFLDSFIETPLMDIVKLRQDTAYQWSVLMFNGEYAEARMKLIMSRLDCKIQQHYAQYIWYKDFYSIFQLMNFLRILQYAHEDKVVKYLKQTLKTIFEHEF